MSSLLRINHFAAAANSAYAFPTPQSLVANTQGVDVSPVSIGVQNAAAKKANKKTWQIFHQALLETVGEGMFQRICRRYSSQMDFFRLKKSGSPLLPFHVKLFSIGSSQVIGRDIRALTGNKIRALSRSELEMRYHQIQPLNIVGNIRDPRTISGGPTAFSALFFHDVVLMDNEKQLLFSDVSRLTFDEWLERMSKVIVNRELLIGQIIPAPGIDGATDHYKVYQKITTGAGLIAYALRPATQDSTLKPLLVFRPTPWAVSHEDAFAAYLNNVERTIGETGWKSSKQTINELMTNPHFKKPNEKIIIAGYSLGGAHAQHFLAAYPEFVFRAVFYNDPNVDEKTALNFAEKVNAMPKSLQMLIEIYRMEGDRVSWVGEKHVGYGVTHPNVKVDIVEWKHENANIALHKLHSHKALDASSFPHTMNPIKSEERDEKLDNSKRPIEQQFYDNFRKAWGVVAYYAFQALSLLIKMVSRLFGVTILRSSRDPNF
jgi:pimeloyl-ACP methyl ester carboxylesterase